MYDSGLIVPKHCLCKKLFLRCADFIEHKQINVFGVGLDEPVGCLPSASQSDLSSGLQAQELQVNGASMLDVGHQETVGFLLSVAAEPSSMLLEQKLSNIGVEMKIKPLDASSNEPNGQEVIVGRHEVPNFKPEQQLTRFCSEDPDESCVHC